MDQDKLIEILDRIANALEAIAAHTHPDSQYDARLRS